VNGGFLTLRNDPSQNFPGRDSPGIRAEELFVREENTSSTTVYIHSSENDLTASVNQANFYSSPALSFWQGDRDDIHVHHRTIGP
jgi:hypothetical protein